MRIAFTGALLLALIACSSNGNIAPAAGGSAKIVVANQQSASASLLNEDGSASRHISVGNGPHEAAISPNGRIAVVTIYGTQQPGNRLAVIDLATDSVIRTIDLGTYTRPHGAAFIGNSSDSVIVTSESTRNVVLVDLRTGGMQAIGTNALGSHMVAINAAGTRAWTANIGGNSVSEIDVTGRQLVRSFNVPAQPEGITVTPNGAEVWVGSNATGAVTVINTTTGAISHTITGATFPYRLTASPDGSRVAIVDGQGDRLLIADVAQHAIVGTIVLTQPRGVAINENNRTAYVTLASGQLAVVDIRNMSVIRTLAVQSSPDGVAVTTRR
jgi:DNA-binding beta-propeller fold protein YncE